MVAEPEGPGSVVVSWTMPPVPPAAGYQVQVTGVRTITENVTGTYITISTNNQSGVYSIQVMSHSRHLPGQTSEPVEVTVTGIHVISICSLTCVLCMYCI